MQCRLLSASTACLLLSGALLGQGAQDPPTFRSGVEYIEVDVLVTDRKGQPVRDLKREDFTLLDSGQPRPILSFGLVDVPLEPVASRKAALGAVESDVTTNVGEGRTFVLAFNNFGKRVHGLARQFVEEVVGPKDQVAILRVQEHPSQAQGFTRSRTLMLQSLCRLLLAGPGDACDLSLRDPEELPPMTSWRPDGGVHAFNVIEGLAAQLGQISGRRKAIIWFDPPSVFHGGPDPAPRFAQRDALREATRNNVPLYVVSSQGLKAPPLGGQRSPQSSEASLNHASGLRLLAEETGGEAIVNSNNFTGGLERFARDNSTYYLLGYEPVAHRDGAFHPLTVRVNRPGVTVRARTGYYALDSAPTATSPAAVERLADDTLEALRMPLSSGALGIDVMATPFKGAGRDGSVLLGALVRGDGLMPGAESRIEVALQATTIEKAIEPGTFKVFTLGPSAVGPAGLLLLDRLTLPRGRYQIRVVVHQSEGKTGNTVVDVEVPNYTKPLVLSGVALGSQSPAGPRVLQGDPALEAILTSTPTLARRFSRTDVVTALVEAYTDASASSASPQVTARLMPVGKGRPLPIQLLAEPREPVRTGYLARVGLRELAPGDYVLTFEARAGKETATRQIPLTVLDAE